VQVVTLSPRDVRELLDRYGLSPRKSLGQHFVVDPNTVRRIASLAGVGEGDDVVEIGAGLGSLTRALAETGARVVAVETDASLLPALREVLESTEVRIVEGDAMQLDWESLLAGSATWHLVANLPYNVATPLVLDVLDQVPAIAELLVMVQREAAERLVAGPGSSAYGIPSLKVRYQATAELVGTVPPTVFLPRPKVESALVRIVRRAEPAVDVPPDALFALVRRAFGQRRKMLRRSLSGVVSSAGFAAAGVREDARPQELGLDEWAALATHADGDL
jgi:16S rRNA (adenine1518-N6/adenine1519-N6)-dimethyltransferase